MQLERHQKKSSSGGFVAITSVTILSAFFIIIFVTAFFLTSEEVDRGIDNQNMLSALSISSGCMELVLEKLRDDVDYSGNETESILFNSGKCDILEVEINGNNRTIKTKGTASSHIKHTEVVVSVENWPELVIISWN